MDLRLTQEPNGQIMIWIEDVPGFEFKSGHTLIECILRQTENYKIQVDEPIKKADPSAKVYAQKLEGFIYNLKFDLSLMKLSK